MSYLYNGVGMGDTEGSTQTIQDSMRNRTEILAGRPIQQQPFTAEPFTSASTASPDEPKVELD